jgi:hypothetical protein
MTRAWQLPPVEGWPFYRTWILDVPWAHPLWSQYAIFLYDLTTEMDTVPNIYLEGATHEFLLYALDPAHKLEPDLPKEIHRLEPANHGYQFIAASDEAAELRIQGVVDLILVGHVSPDTDFGGQWDVLFKDGHSLKRS